MSDDYHNKHWRVSWLSYSNDGKIWINIPEEFAYEFSDPIDRCLKESLGILPDSSDLFLNRDFVTDSQITIKTRFKTLALFPQQYIVWSILQHPEVNEVEFNLHHVT